MALEIHVHNAQARLHAPREIVAQLRPLVAYREQTLPRVAVQAIIKAFMRGRRSHGRDNDVDRLYRDPESYRRLDEEGRGYDNRVTAKELEAVMRLPGMWDGWRSLVSPGGHFGTGLVSHVERAMTLRLGLPAPQVVDLRQRHEPQNFDAYPDLYSFQAEAVAAWRAAGGRGVVNLPPRSGKTHIAIAAACGLGLRTLMVVPTKNLVTQTVERFRQFMHPSEVQGVTGGRPNARKQRRMNNALVWIATPPTAAGPKPKGDRRQHRPGMQGIESRQLLIIDEFHHAAADLWQDISLAAINAYYRLGLTGTHYRADGKDLAMHAVLSRCVYRRSVTEMVGLDRLVPARVALVRVPPPDVSERSGHDVYPAGVVDHPARNELAARAAAQLAAMGKRVLVLTKEVRHSKHLAAQIPGAVQVDGTQAEAVEAALGDLQAGKIRCLVGTSVIGEGVDVPAADALVYAAGGRSSVKVVQDYFRVLTPSPGKRYGIVVDFADGQHPRLLEASAHRLALYRAEEAFTADVVSPPLLSKWLENL